MMKFRNAPTALPILLMVGLLLAMAGCSLEAPDDPSALNNPPGVEDAGARYVAVGNSLTAGFTDGGLIMSGQTYSYPNLIAGQLGLGSSRFTQPYIASPGIGGVSGGNVTGVLYFNGSGLAVLGTTPLADVQSVLLLAATQPTQYHNLGVPGAVLHDGMNAYSSTTATSYVLYQSPNPFFDFINRPTLFANKAVASGYPTPGGLVPVTFQSTSQFYQAVAKGGALTTLWLGNNDVLGPATSGEPTAGFGPAGAATFQADYTALLAMLAGGLEQRNNGLKPTIVVANLPSVASTPYFIPRDQFEAAIGGGWPGGYEEGRDNVVYVRFPTLTWVQSHATDTAIPDEYTLDTGETADVNAATTTYNQIIAGVAANVHASGVARVGVMDANALLAGRSQAEKTHFLFLLGAGMTVEQAAATTLFSLDGIHPNSHGQGVMANAFIDVINGLDGTDLAHVDPAALPWDPTYGQSPATKSGALFGLDAQAAEAMDAIFR
jgi:lysophospholipase L1-like esterase